jgi:hypothetical protein
VVIVPIIIKLMLVMMVASWLIFSNVLKQTLFLRNGDKLEVFRNQNIS